MQKDCSACGNTFEITDSDLKFYQKVSPQCSGEVCTIPQPTHCAQCRLQRRLAWRNERTLSKKACGLCNKQIISIQPEDFSAPVYCNQCWWSDKWDPLEYGQEFDFSRPFFEQFIEMRERVPQIAIMNDNGISSENCDYCQDFVYGKNCYLCVGTWDMHDSCYCNQCDHARNMVDSDATLIECEQCYECIDSQKLYNCIYMQNSENCTDCSFGFDLKGCKYCFCCFGLRNKEYCIFNEQYSKEDYTKKLQEFDISVYSNFEKYRLEFIEWIKQFPRKCLNMQRCEDCHGDSIFNSKAVHGFVVSNGEYGKNVIRSDKPIHCQDIFNSGKPELCYECWTVDESYQVAFSQWTNRCKFSYYCDCCDGSQYLFGCISMKKSKYCILNRQYTEDEYNRLLPKIITHMQEHGEYGEFFPMRLSSYPYNHTVAHEFFPFTQKQAKQKGCKWCEKNDDVSGTTKTIDADRLPDRIEDIPDDVLNWAIRCSESGRPFKIIPLELKQYRTMGIPLPRLHPDVRHVRRLRRRNPWMLWKRKCSQCSKEIETTYSPERPEKVLCESCYLEEVY